MLTSIKKMPPGTFIFSDLERLKASQLKILGSFCEQLLANDENIPLFNNPVSALSRYSLLRKLYDDGFNKYNVCKVADTECTPQYPLFLRRDNDHSGPRSKLLGTPEEKNDALLKALIGGIDINNLIQIEFCETKSDDGYYRKYSAFRIGNEIIPAHIIFDTNWIAKDTVPPDSESIELEKEKFKKENPHADRLLEIFNLAGINFGRIDYGMLDGTMQTWEINTNPILIKRRKDYTNDKIIAIKEQLAKRLENAFMSINLGGDIKSIKQEENWIELTWDYKKIFGS
jgi:hypothetical protein